jgi:D-aminopeptidase
MRAPAPRLRDLGLTIGLLPPGPRNSISDVGGVRVGHATLIEGAGPLLVGSGPVRTGVTVVLPHAGDPFGEAVFAGAHRLNGNGELTGLEWIRESGRLTSPIAITNTHSVGVVRDALVAAAHRPGSEAWTLPVVGETYDGWLNDIDGQHVRAEHLRAALAAASDEVAEGNVGGGTGMLCHHFKGGIGTASRVIAEADGGWIVGALVQANYGRRERLSIDGVPIGREIGVDVVPSAWAEPSPSPAGLAADVPPTADVPPAADPLPAADLLPTADLPPTAEPLPAADLPPEAGHRDADDPSAPPAASRDAGSIIVILATDAPLLPHQCRRLAQRGALGIARAGGAGENSSGDLILAFATGNTPFPVSDTAAAMPRERTLRAADEAWLSPLFWAAIESVEEAIANALVAAETMTGRDGHVAHRLPHDLLVEAWQRHRRSGA